MQDLNAINIALAALIIVLMTGFVYVIIRWSYLWRDEYTVVEWIVGMIIFAFVTHLAGVNGLIEDSWRGYERWLIWYCCLGAFPVTFGFMIFSAMQRKKERAKRKENQKKEHESYGN